MLNCPHCFAENLGGAKTCQSCGGLVGTPSTNQQLSGGSGLQNGEYEILEVLGEGGFGITYRARKNSLGIEYAIKELMPLACSRNNGMVVPPRSQGSADWQQEIQRFTREAQLLKQFRDNVHYPGIVSVEDIFQEHSTAYMVMEFLSGDTLRSRLQRFGKISSEDCAFIARKICASLHEIHTAGLLHRDIKPDNVMLERGGRVVLIDFGSARDFAAGQTMSHTQMLTPGYAPLEQYSSAARFGPYTDIYSLGATLYALLSATDPPDALARITGTKLDLNFVPAEWRELIDMAMAMPTTDRPQSAKEFARLIPNTSVSPSTPQSGINPQNVPTVRLVRPSKLPPHSSGKSSPSKQRFWIFGGLILVVASMGGSVLINRFPESPMQIVSVMPNRVDVPPLPDAVLARKIFQEVTLKKPIFVTTLMLGNIQTIVGCLTGKSQNGDSIGCITINQIANQWSRQNLNDGEVAPEFTYLTSGNDFELQKIGMDDFIFFTVKSNSMGNAAGNLATVEFVLYNIKTSKILSLKLNLRRLNDQTRMNSPQPI